MVLYRVFNIYSRRDSYFADIRVQALREKYVAIAHNASYRVASG